MSIITDSKKIEEILNRGVEEVIVKQHLEKRLRKGEKLRVKFGIDPTGPKIHIGRATALWKLKDFQDLGHQIVLIVGDFTAQIGDASDKTSMRRPLTEKEVKENMKDYKKQIGRILNIDKVEIRHNSEWLNKVSWKEKLSLSMKFTAQQMIQRRNFKERWNKDKPIGLHELDYPLLQGYDSMAVKADVEVGGFDQLFNLKTGRDIQKIFKQPPQDIMTLKMLFGLDGRKMSTSWGNVINITEEPGEMYGKIMSMKDELIGDYFELATKIPLSEIKEIKKHLKAKILNPREAKARLAKELCQMYWGKNKAAAAEKEFNKVFKEKKLPSKIPLFKPSKKILNILQLLLEAKLVSSKSEAKRVVQQGGVKINGKPETNWRKTIELKKGMVLQVGKRRFAKTKI